MSNDQPQIFVLLAMLERVLAIEDHVPHTTIMITISIVQAMKTAFPYGFILPLFSEVMR